MKLNNNKNIIVDSDITMTGEHTVGKELSDVVDGMIDDIAKLKGNLAWAYRFGGLGGGSGSGGGSSSNNFGIIVTANGQNVSSSGATLTFENPGTYTFSVRITKGGSDAFKVVYTVNGKTYNDNNITSQNDFTSTKSFQLTKNGTLTISVINNSTMEYYTLPNGDQFISYKYIVTPYTFGIDYYAGSDTQHDGEYDVVTSTNGSVFMSNYTSTGIVLGLKYAIAVPINTAESNIEYVDWEGISHKLTFSELNISNDSSGIKYFTLAQDIIPYLSNKSNAGYKAMTVNVNIKLNESTSFEKAIVHTLNVNLIPTGLYLKVASSTGTLYDTYDASTSATSENQFNSTGFSLTITPYYGGRDTTRTYTYNFFVYNVDNLNDAVYSGTGTANDQTNTILNIKTSGEGYKAIYFTLTCNQAASVPAYTKWYYISVKSVSSSFNWYHTITEGDSTIVNTPFRSAYYRKGLSADNIVIEQAATGNQENLDIRMTANSNIRTVSFTNTIDENKLPELDAFLALGIQYSKINNYDMPICSFNASGSTATSIAAGSIFIYQNKVIVTSNESRISGNTVNVASKTDAAGESTLFIPLCTKIDTSDKGLENYHLISIYKNLESRTDNNYNRSMKCFIDGTLDGVAQTFTASHKHYESITFYPANYDINLIERSYFEHVLKNNDVVATAEDEDYNERKYVTENDIKGYWYSYKQQLLNFIMTDEEREMQIYNIFDQFKYTKDNHVIVESGVAADLARLVECPVIELVWQDNGNGAGEYSGNGQNNCLLWLDKSYGENDREYQVDVILKYAQEGIGTELKTITLPGSATPATFRIEIQGSSTKSYLAKNLELYAPSSTATTTFVYTPNWDIESSKSLLPENSFTLKKDVVDSSHTNNNAIADFVDAVTTKYEDAASSQNISPESISSLSGMSSTEATNIINKYKRKIKNCLTGFPVLVFLNTTYYDTDGVNTKNENYFLGIYNFNLGRKSYNNLGYNSLAPIINALSAQGVENGFNLFEINNDEIKMIPTVEVAEIQGNSAFYDFSQYDDTILSEMWGDYISGSESSTSQMTHLKAHIKSLVQNISKAGGYVFTAIGKEMSADPNDNFGYDYGYGKVPTANTDGTTTLYVPNYMQQVKKTQSSSTGYDYVWSPTTAGTESNYVDTILRYTNTDTQEIHTPVVDFTSLSEYYTICMAFGMVDSVQKNLNMKSWTANVENDQTIGQRWYPAFYDMDTALGINNAGNRINYFAFSDYWKSSITRDSKGNNILGQATIWRDYAPHDDENTSAFFDVPSSYLFAMCKYASVLLKTNEYYNEGAYIYNDPVNIWATLRDGVQSGTNKMQGQLASARYFVNNYFKHHLDTIPDEAFNLDYVYNYLYKKQGIKSTVFDEQNIGKFWGRKTAYVEYWLDGRLHILDAYFNINQITNDLIYTNPLTHTQYFATAPEYVPVNNDDIYLLREIFSNTVNGSTTGQQYQKGTIVVNVTANPYSPIVVQKAGKEKMRYLFPSESIPVQMTFEVSGTEYWVFFGSQQWTSLSSINGFINQSGAFIVNSDYFASLVGNAGTCGTWTINTPALKTLSLTSENYSGSLDFNGNVETEDRTQYENLDAIDISNTAINLNVNKMNVTSITALNMKGTNLICTDLPNITSMQISGTFISLTLCSWQHGIRLPYSGALNVDTITISNDTQRFPDNILTVSGSNVKTLNITGFAYIKIDNCPNLTNINITDEDTSIIKGISITMPNGSASQPVSDTISINGNEANVFDLSQFTSLERICFNNCKYLTDVILPDVEQITLEPMCFANCTALSHITGIGDGDLSTKLYITGQRTFYNCPAMNFTNASGQPAIQLYVAPETTSLRDTFYCESAQERINLAFAVSILERCTSEYVSNVTDITNMFRNTPIRYNAGTYMNEYNNGYSSLSLAGFENCANWVDMFRETQVTFLNRYIFGPSTRGNGIAYNIESFDYRPLGADSRFSTTTDGLYEIIEKITRYHGSTRPIQFVDSHASEMTALKLNDFFCPSDKRPERLFYIERFKCEPTIGSTRIDYDFDGMFDSGVDELHYKWLALHGESARPLYLEGVIDSTIYTSNVNGLEYLLHNVKIQYIVNSLNIGILSSASKPAMDIMNFIDWDNGLEECTNLFLARVGLIEGVSRASGFQINKYVSYSDMHHIIGALLRCKKLEYVSGIFKNAIITVTSNEANDWFSFCDDDTLSDTGSEANTSIKYMNDMFNGMSLRSSYDSAVQYPIKISHDFMRFFPNVIGFAYTFANLYVANTLPFDFFRKRQDNVSTVAVDTMGNTGKLHTFTYRKEIVDAQYCFENISMPVIQYTGGNIDEYSWDGMYAFHSDADYNCGTFIRDYVEQDDNALVQYEYYVNGVRKEVSVNDEIQDAINAEMPGYSTYKYHINDEYNTNKVLFNISYVDPTGLFVAPDIFYGFTQSGVIENFFAVTRDRIGTALTGTIPAHMLKEQNISKSFVGIINNMNITPIYLGSRYDSVSDDGHIYKYYVYVPEGFTEKQQLSECFKFNIILPYSTSEYREYFMCMLTSSVSIYTGSLVNVFPDATAYLSDSVMTSTLFPKDADSMRDFAYGDTGIRYALCGQIYGSREVAYSTDTAERTLAQVNVSTVMNKEVTISTTSGATYHYIVSGSDEHVASVKTTIKVEDNTRITVWLDGNEADRMIVTYTFNVSIGFDTTALSYLLYDNLVMQRDILCILSGYLFNNMMQWTGAKVNMNTSSYVLYTNGVQTIPMNMSYNLLLNGTASNDRLLSCSLQGSKKYSVNAKTMFNYTSSQADDWMGINNNYNSALEIV